ncbi:MAG TPA: hypothetical protein DEO85_03655 [Maritimibacter sp.]|nr:hypothetical protein [Maritimibacter sp.]
MEPRTLFESETLRVVMRENRHADNDDTLLSFTGVGFGWLGKEGQELEFFGFGREYRRTLFIFDLTRSWGNAFDLEDLGDIVRSVHGTGDITAIGNSMGGALAIASSSIIPIRKIVAFAPQYSVHPDIVKDERWQEYRSRITQWHLPELGSRLWSNTDTTIIYGDLGRDREHAALYQADGKAKVFFAPGAHHTVAMRIKKWGLLDKTVSLALQGGLNEFWVRRKLDFRPSSAKRSPAWRRARTAKLLALEGLWHVQNDMFGRDRRSFHDYARSNFH